MSGKDLTIRGIQSHLIEKGTGKEVIVFLHGWGEKGGAYLADIADRIVAKEKMRGIVVDLPGFGASATPPNAWGTQDYAEWLAELLKVLDVEKAHFYGHSFGCRVIVRFLLTHPGWQGKIVLTGAAGIKWPLSFRQKINQTLTALARPLRPLLPKKLIQLKNRALGAHDLAVVSPVMESTFKRVIGEEDFRDELPRIENEVLLIWGEDDGYTPLRSGRVYAEKLPHAHLEVLPGGRHGIHHTHTEEIVQLVDKFLRI